jgi:hypothetical protein
MRVENLVRNGRAVANQFIITERGNGALGNFVKRCVFQSRDKIIAVVTTWPAGWPAGRKVELDPKYWSRSACDIYRNIFLGESKEKLIAEYKLTDLQGFGRP